MAKYQVKRYHDISCGHVTRHLDGKPSNNNILNLEWGSLHENIEDSFIHGTRIKNQNRIEKPKILIDSYSQNKGSRHGKSKLTETEVIEIMNDNRNYTEIGAKYNVSPQTIGSIKKGWSWNHITGIARRFAGDKL